MKILVIYLLVGVIASIIMYIADRKGLVGEDYELGVKDHIVLILFWPLVIISTIMNLAGAFDDDEEDDGTESYS